MKVAAVLLVLALGAGCGGGAVTAVHVESSATIAITPAPDELPFDPRGARLHEATEQLSALAGHAVSFQFDAALVSELQSGFEDQLIASVEAVAQGLAAWKKDEPAAFARSASALQHVVCRYRAALRSARATLDAATGVLTVDLPSRIDRLISRGLVYVALQDESDAWADKAYGGASPDSVPAAQRRAYFGYLIATRPGYGALYERRFRAAQRSLSRADRLAQSPHADVILKVLRLLELAKGTDAGLERDASAWLWDQLDWFGYRYAGDQKELAQVGAGTPFRHAESAYMRWLAAQLPHATLAQQRVAARRFFAHDIAGCTREGCTRQAGAFPGIDTFAFGLGVVDAWARAGHPAAKEHDARTDLLDSVVCPYERDADGKLSYWRGCSAGWVIGSVVDDATRARLARALDQRKDAVLVADVFMSMKYAPAGPLLALFRALDPKGPAWRTAAGVLGGELFDDHSHELVEEGQRLWKAHPEHRGTALYFVARSKRGEPQYYVDKFFKGFARSWGAGVDEPMLSEMLGYGLPAMELVPSVWPALTRGFSHAGVVVSRLDALIPDAAAPSAGRALRALSAVVGRLCEDADAAGLGTVHAYLARRSGAKPAETKALATLTRDTAPGGCKARKREPADATTDP